jgi:hypothetical protein
LAATTQDEWVSKSRARRLLGCGQANLERLIAQGRIGVRRLPNSLPRVSLGDVEALLAASTRPATTPSIGDPQ